MKTQEESVVKDNCSICENQNIKKIMKTQYEGKVMDDCNIGKNHSVKKTVVARKYIAPSINVSLSVRKIINGGATHPGGDGFGYANPS